MSYEDYEGYEDYDYQDEEFQSAFLRLREYDESTGMLEENEDFGEEEFDPIYDDFDECGDLEEEFIPEEKDLEDLKELEDLEEEEITDNFEEKEFDIDIEPDIVSEKIEEEEVNTELVKGLLDF
jgi:hypothetical protein